MDPVAKYNAIVSAARFNRPKKEMLLELVSVFLKEPLSIHKVTFGKAAYIDQRPEVLTDPDTFVQAEIDPAYDYRFPGENGFLYRRLPNTAWVAQPGRELIAPEFPFTTADMLESINLCYSVNLTEEDIINDEYDFGDVVFRLRMHPNSWCWFGTRVLPVVFGIPSDARLTQDGDIRVTEAGDVRIVFPEL